jgi:hypothetical protein
LSKALTAGKGVFAQSCEQMIAHRIVEETPEDFCSILMGNSNVQSRQKQHHILCSDADKNNTKRYDFLGRTWHVPTDVFVLCVKRCVCTVLRTEASGRKP